MIDTKKQKNIYNNTYIYTEKNTQHSTTGKFAIKPIFKEKYLKHTTHRLFK